MERGKVITVSGTAWGDESKAKVIDYLIWLNRGIVAVLRQNGGGNAGHHVKNGDREFSFHQISSGIFHPPVSCISGSGMVIDAVNFSLELDHLKKIGISPEGRIIISDKAHLTFPWHYVLEAIIEESKGEKKVGTTRKAIGTTYMEKMLRSYALRTGYTLFPKTFREKYERALDWYIKFFKGMGVPSKDNSQMEKDCLLYLEHALRLRKYVRNIDGLAKEQVMAGHSILMEMAQGPLLDIDHGTYPYLTSSNTFPPYGLKDIAWTDYIVAVVKAYTTRVGGGPLAGELTGEEGRHIQSKGKEYGTTTGRPRRISWLDLVATKYTLGLMWSPHVKIHLAVAKLDVLDDFPEIKVIIHYRYKGKKLECPPSWDEEVLSECKPVYKTFPGWQRSTSDCRKREDLPKEAVGYVEFIENFLGFSCPIVSVGPDRSETIQFRPSPF